MRSAHLLISPRIRTSAILPFAKHRRHLHPAKEGGASAMAFLFGAFLGLVVGLAVVMAFARHENIRTEQRRELVRVDAENFPSFSDSSLRTLVWFYWIWWVSAGDVVPGFAGISWREVIQLRVSGIRRTNTMNKQATKTAYAWSQILPAAVIADSAGVQTADLGGAGKRMEYKPGTSNVVVDALSRRDMGAGSVLAISGPSFDIVRDLWTAVASDPALVALMDQVTADTLGLPWSVVDSILLHDGKFSCHLTRQYRKPLSPVRMMHHEGVEKSLCRFRRDFHTPRERAVVHEFVRHCAAYRRKFVYSTAYHSALKESPFKVVYGWDPLAIRSYDFGDCRVAAVAQAMEERDEFPIDVRAHLL
ncbi:hypothetical protein U9M48_039599 [Paspalum notatum var. saurae]|uniref:Uncharacterized protein n=1 Tax=Paspalum notatum var. saurae TaxID=547442 RepID=A0AAQ3UL15_PASNO